MLLILWGQSWRSGTKCGRKPDWLWVRSPLEEMKYLLKFPFLRSGVEAKRGVEFCYSTRLQDSAESGEWTVLTLSSLCLPCCVRNTARSWFIYKFYDERKERSKTITLLSSLRLNEFSCWMVSRVKYSLDRNTTHNLSLYTKKSG